METKRDGKRKDVYIYFFFSFLLFFFFLLGGGGGGPTSPRCEKA